jgi:D-3-phosphoglycerate dehydrogenase
VGTIAKLGFTNHEDFTSSKEQIEAKIQDYQGIVIRSRFKIDKEFLDKATNLQFIARGCGSGKSTVSMLCQKISNLSLRPKGIAMQLLSTRWE